MTGGWSRLLPRCWPGTAGRGRWSALYGSADVLAVGLAGQLCARAMHGDVTYFNVNRHINPTNVCVAACKLCAFGRKKGDPPDTRWPWKKRGRRRLQATRRRDGVSHCWRLHPDLPLEYFLDLVKGLKERFRRCTSRPSPWWKWPTWRGVPS